MVNVDQEKCIGCEACVAINSEVFEMVEGKAKVKAGQEGNSDAKDAIEGCPVEAINQ